MANTTTSPNMNLPVPVVGVDPGPQYATDIDSCLGLIDSHDHSPGNGVPLTPDGLNISSDLSIENNNLTVVKGVRFNTQTPATPSVSPNVDTLYVSGHDLYYNDSAGHQVQITLGGSVAGAPGNIANLTPPATASFYSIGGKFMWMSTGSAFADMEFAGAILHNPDNFANAVTVVAPPSSAAPFTLTLPFLPSSSSFLQMSSSGVMSAVIPISQGLTASNLSASANILGSQLDPSANIVGTQLSASAGILGSQLASNANFPGNTVQENGQNVIVSNTNAASSLSVIRAYINASAGVVYGEGIATVGQPFAGVYTITYTTPFASAPVVLLTPVSNNPADLLTASIDGAATNSAGTVTILISDLAGTLSSRDFTFLAIGPR